VQDDIIIVAYIGGKCKSRVARMMIRLRRNDSSPLANISCRKVYRVLTYRMSKANISCLLIEKAERRVRSALTS